MSLSAASLADLRREIDQIDDSLHDLLMRRADLQTRVAAAKDDGDGYIRPGREARVLRRLMERHAGILPRPVVVRIWREIFAAGLCLQSPFSLALSAPANKGEDLHWLAREHFGVMTELRESGSPRRVLQAVADREVSAGLLAMPQSEEPDPWWPALARHGADTPTILARLPFARTESRGPRVEALVVALTPPDPTGEDRGLLAVATPDQTSRSALRTAVTEAGFALKDWRVHTVGGEVYYLIETGDIPSLDDPRLAALRQARGGVVRDVWPLGGYAVPLEPAKLA